MDMMLLSFALVSISSEAAVELEVGELSLAMQDSSSYVYRSRCS